ncbi:hypothetical protein [Methanomassiliicoccus luminyensis]|jgi:hypothetical protein|uniref:hypothetical protein n=1 Tax=Methanomassiliicoccus luminyensis TaxID=1080712 RepID=UPI0012DFB4F2|nr:hypothetical protein [Methanomassiliicoccus luminyensis]
MQGNMQFVRMVCSYCGASAEGFKGDLEMIGWSAAEVAVKGGRVKRTACPAHRDLLERR